jgi:23S rRNA (adenine2503-C2)-methyltransferase
MHLFALTCNECTEAFSAVGTARFHAVAWYRQALKYGKPVGDPDCRLPEGLDWSMPAICATVEQEGVVKIGFELKDGLYIETVIIPADGRTTLCVSSQAGCRMGCRFCATGAGGFRRNLLPEEIVGQVFVVRHGLGRPVDNLVFMGMGEPLDNVLNVVQAIRVLSDQRGFDIAPRHITVSTAGLPDGLRHLGGCGFAGLRLAISLNAANDQLRSYLMPVNRTHPLTVLKQALQRYPLRKKEVFFIEYVLLKGVNDSPEHAAELTRFLEGLPVRVNVIAYNPGPDSRFESPDPEACKHFCALLARDGVFVRLRSSRGQTIQAACGQLADSGCTFS